MVTGSSAANLTRLRLRNANSGEQIEASHAMLFGRTV
jgi:hypothetical protein